MLLTDCNDEVTFQLIITSSFCHGTIHHIHVQEELQIPQVLVLVIVAAYVELKDIIIHKNDNNINKLFISGFFIIII
jgi:hypothetical protein